MERILMIVGIGDWILLTGIGEVVVLGDCWKQHQVGNGRPSIIAECLCGKGKTPPQCPAQ